MLLKPRIPTNITPAKNILLEQLRKFPVLHREDDGRAYEDEYAFILTKRRNGLATLTPNISTQGLLFRGDSTNSPRGKRSLLDNFYNDRQQEGSKELGFELMLEEVKYLDFAHAVYSFPLNKMFSDGIKMPDGEKIIMLDPIGLSHSYGYRTPLISLTSDIDIAIFFAVTCYNKQTHQYEIPEPGSEGVLYSYEMRRNFGSIKGLSALGLHVFPRPGLNKEFLFNLGEDMDFNSLPSVRGYIFNQDETISRQYLKKYDEGRALMPENDFLFQHICSFPKNKVSAISLGLYMIDVAESVKKRFREYLDEVGIEVTDYLFPFFRAEELRDFYQHIGTYWADFCRKIIFPEDEKIQGITYREFFEHLPEHGEYGKFFSIDYLNHWTQ